MSAEPREPTVSAAHRHESVQADRRWLVVWTSLFVGWLALSGIAIVVYPEIAPDTVHPTFGVTLAELWRNFTQDGHPLEAVDLGWPGAGQRS